MKPINVPALACAAFLTSTALSRAALLVYEGFNYPAGAALTNSSANSAGNGFGWGGRWTGVNNPLATNSPGNLSFTDLNGNTLLTDGGKVIIGVPGGTTANAQASRSFNLGTLNTNTYTGLTNSPGTYWMSFMMQWIGPQTAGSTTNLYVRKGDLTFRQGAQTNATSTGPALFAVGSPNAGNRIGTPVDTWATWSGNDAGAGIQNTGLAAATNQLTNSTFVLARIDLDGGPGLDTVYTWFDWTNLLVEPTIGTASTTNNTSNEDGFNNIRLDANGGSAAGTNTVLALDEFRLGTSFADVTPLAALPQPPNITQHPQSLTVVVTNPATFSVTATGDPPLHYQWYFNTNTPVGTDTNYFTIASATTNDSGEYFCVVTNNNGTVTSLVATLTVVLPVPPAISTQPQDFTNVVGFNANFAVTATGTAPLRYQWYFNSTPLGTGTNATLSFAITSTNDAGNYFVIVTNLFGAVTSSVATLTVVPGWPAGLPAFSGADGAGKFTSGGRGGVVYHVTKLDRNFSHNEAGTLRYGLTDANFPSGVPRTIVFDVAGTFWLGRYGAERPDYDNGWDAQSSYSIPRNITLAGQSAPGPVIIAGGVSKPGSSNVVLRNITFAPGYGMRGFNEPDKEPPTVPTPGNFPDSFIFDALEINGPNTMLDHLTLLYGSAGTIWLREQADNLTMQYCTVALAQNYPHFDPNVPGQYRGFAFGSHVQGGANVSMSFHNNLSAHLYGPLVITGNAGVGNFNDFRNNVTYNWLSYAGYSAPSGLQSHNNFINNFYLTGPGGDGVSSTNIIYSPGRTNIFVGVGAGVTQTYVSGNLKDVDTNGSPSDAISADNDYLSVGLQPAAYDVNIGLTLPTADGLTNVLRYVGSRWWTRAYDFALGNTNAISTNDVAAYLDQRVIMETATGTGKVMAWADDPFDNNPSEGWDWRALLALRADSNAFSAPFSRSANWDTDGDGMPDTWEIAHGLNPNAANNNGDFDSDGYTDLEEYLNEIAAWPAPGPILFTGEKDNRYAMIFNWRVNGQQVNIAGLGNVTTFSYWQPSRFDTAVISNITVIVDAVGQHAGTLQLTNNATLDITNGWLEASSLNIGTGCTFAVKSAGTLRLTGSGSITLAPGATFTNAGRLDIMTWSGTLPPGFVNTGTVLDRSLIQMSSPQVSGANFQVTIQGYVGHTYQLQYRDDLSNGGWQSISSSVAGAGAPITLVHTGGASAEQRLYRVLVAP